jgi:hypothetical protein
MQWVYGRKQVVHDDEAQVRCPERALVAVHSQKMWKQGLIIRDDMVVVPAFATRHEGERSLQGAN